MSFVSSLFGGQNDFKAKADLDQYHQDQAKLAGDPNALTPIMGQAGQQALATPQMSFADAINGGQQQALQQGLANQQFQQGQQANIADLQAQAAGTAGPSLADTMLKQQSDAAAAKQAGAIAGTKGMNPAAQARLILQQGAQGQQAAAQAGAMQKAQEQMAARQALTSALNAGQQGAVSGQGAATGLMGAGAGANTSQQNANTSLLGTAGQIQNAANANNIQNTLGAGQINAQVAANNQAAQMHAQDVNAGIAQQNASNSQGIFSGLLGAAGGAMTMGLGGVAANALGHAHGGVIGPRDASFTSAIHAHMAPRFALGGEMPAMLAPPSVFTAPQAANNMGASFAQGAQLAKAGRAFLQARHNDALQKAAIADAVNAGHEGADESAGLDTTMTPAQALAAHIAATPPPAAPPSTIAAGTHPLASAQQMATPGFGLPMQHGGKVPGRAKVDGDSPENDTKVAMLSPGEGVIPRSIMQAPDAPERAKQFIEHLKSKNPEKGPKGYGDVLKRHRELEERVQRMEAMFCGGKVK